MKFCLDCFNVSFCFFLQKTYNHYKYVAKVAPSTWLKFVFETQPQKNKRHRGRSLCYAIEVVI